MHADTKLYLVFEFLDVDLKRYMDNKVKAKERLSVPIVKVRLIPAAHALVRSQIGPLPLDPTHCVTHSRVLSLHPLFLL